MANYGGSKTISMHKSSLPKKATLVLIRMATSFLRHTLQ